MPSVSLNDTWHIQNKDSGFTRQYPTYYSHYRVHNACDEEAFSDRDHVHQNVRNERYHLGTILGFDFCDLLLRALVLTISPN